MAAMMNAAFLIGRRLIHLTLGGIMGDQLVGAHGLGRRANFSSSNLHGVRVPFSEPTSTIDWSIQL